MIRAMEVILSLLVTCHVMYLANERSLTSPTDLPQRWLAGLYTVFRY
jgi:hypothetical protein